MYVCLCKGITDKQVQCALSEHGSNPEALITSFDLNRDCCGRCAENIEDLIQNMTERSAQ